MAENVESSDELMKLYNNIVLQEKLEKQAAGALTSDILSKLNISVETLPLECQRILHEVASTQAALGFDTLDKYKFFLLQLSEQAETLEDEYEMLRFKQKNTELQVKIDRNKKILENLRRDLANSKESLANQDPNPDNIGVYIRQLQQKVASYERSCEKAKMNFSKLSVPESIYPASLSALAKERDRLKQEAETLRLQAEDVKLLRETRGLLNQFKK